MEISKLLILLCCVYCSIATNSHTIPIEDYKTELQDLGQHIEYPETPVKVIKITKTVAVKVPVPYPVKVVEKVPYPVHVSKPYPVPVPQIVHLPHAPPAPQAAKPHEHEPLDYHHAFPGLDPYGDKQQAAHYQPAHHQVAHEENDGAHPQQENQEDSFEGNHGPASYYGFGGEHDEGALEKSYDQALKEYLSEHHGTSVKAGLGHYY